jgi:hypothetical protein
VSIYLISFHWRNTRKPLFPNAQFQALLVAVSRNNNICFNGIGFRWRKQSPISGPGTVAFDA